MPNSQKAVYSETPHKGGWLWLPATLIQVTPSGANLAVFTKNAVGDYSWNRTAAGAETFVAVASPVTLRRLLEVVDFQEAFGSAVAGPSAAGPKGTFNVPPVAGFPLTPSAIAQAKGIRIIDVAAVYQVGVAALTSAALSLNETKFVNAVAPAVVNQPISPTALPLATQGTPYVVVRSVNAPAFIVDDLSDVNLELAIVLQNTGTLRIYGLGFHCDFNYN